MQKSSYVCFTSIPLHRSLCTDERVNGLVGGVREKEIDESDSMLEWS